jgi:FHS family L-fucose permease-like MFS transporter
VSLITTVAQPNTELALQRTTQGPALAILSSVFFMWGFISCLNDILAPHLKSVFALNYTQTMLIQLVFFGTYFLISLPAARLLELIGYKNSIAVGLVTTGIGALVFVPAATQASYNIFLTALFILATGITTLQVAANAYVAILGPPATASSRLNLVQAFNSLGTTLAPWFGGLLILSRATSGLTQGNSAVLTMEQRMQDALAVRLPYIGIAIMLFALALLILFWRLPRVSTRPDPTGVSHDHVWRHPRLILGILAIFFYVGAEIAVGSFLINYVSSPSVVPMSHASASFYVSLFWGSAMTGRFLGSAVMRRVSPARVLFGATLGAFGLLAISIGTTGHLALWAVVLVGLMNSIMFPTIFTLSIAGLGKLTARGSALLIMAIVGGAVIPIAQGAIADRFGLRIAFIAPLLCYLYVFYFAIHCVRHPPTATLDSVTSVPLQP